MTDLTHDPTAATAAVEVALTRIRALQTSRLRHAAGGREDLAVAMAGLINDILDGLTPAQLRAALIAVTSPETAPAGPATSAEEGVGGQAAPALPVLDHILALVAAYGLARAEWALAGQPPQSAYTVDGAMASVHDAVEELAMAVLIAQLDTVYQQSPGLS
ncbi:hypothetical protein ABZS66_19020 [Dactylosporangium sp. NPDC005572]|uniref:hypothetical protein n=1 Tax=Dactylosporangium sp. NPDC005572 TaxID=3156889 RepID=UPI0033A63950